MAVIKSRCNGLWTEAKFNSFIKNALRSASIKWAPIQTCKKRANVERGKYKCECCGKIGPATIRNEEGKKKNNAAVDHILPIVKLTGFESWDSVVERMFVEEDMLQVLCDSCHSLITNEENRLRREYKKGKVDLDSNKEYIVYIEDGKVLYKEYIKNA